MFLQGMSTDWCTSIGRSLKFDTCLNLHFIVYAQHMYIQDGSGVD